MKTALISTIILLATMKLFGQKLPSEWDKFFVISVSHTGSMSGGSSHVTFTHDSCKYVTSSLDAPSKEKKFPLSQADRSKILQKMQELKVGSIKAGMSIAVQSDGWSDMLCYGGHCIEGGSASVMSEKDKGIFSTACRYLEGIAINK
jgi:hypothetical protein